MQLYELWDYINSFKQLNQKDVKNNLNKLLEDNIISKYDFFKIKGKKNIRAFGFEGGMVTIEI